VAAHPSDDPVLERLGRRLGDFLRAEGDETRGALADLEHARLLALIAPPAPVVEAGDVDPQTFAAARLVLSPARVRLRLAREVLALWLDPSLAILGEELVDVVAFRKHHSVQHVALDPDEAAALELVDAGACVADVCAAFADHPSPETRASQVLATWLRRTWIASIVPATQDTP
jgi:hypothetical protein